MQATTARRLEHLGRALVLSAPVAEDEADVAVALGVAVNTARREHAPGGTPQKQASKEWQNRVLNLHELVPLARQSLTAVSWSYLRGGSDTEMTLKRNRHALDSTALEQSILNDVSQINPSTSIFGRDLAMPVLTAPMGNITSLDEAHYSFRDVNAGTAGGQVTVARAAARSGVGHCLSSLGRGWDAGGTYLEETAEASGDGALKIFQLYVRGDWDYVKEYTERAIDAGCASHPSRNNLSLSFLAPFWLRWTYPAMCAEESSRVRPQTTPSRSPLMWRSTPGATATSPTAAPKAPPPLAAEAA